MIDERLKYFKLLGISPTDNQDLIKKAYRKMAFRFHPDKNQSADAHQRFIQITEAYEVLTGQRKAVVQPQLKPRSDEEIVAEKVAFAKERYKRQMEEEARKDALYYKLITTGWKWSFFKAGAYYAAIMSLLLTVDYFADGGQETIIAPKGSISAYHKTIAVKNEYFYIENYDYWDSKYWGQIRGNRSYLFKDLKSISVVLNPPDMEINTHSDKLKKFQGFEEFKLYTHLSFNSMYGVFPLVHLFLLVPLTLVYFKRPILRFSIWRLVSIYILFPLAIFLAISNDRIFHLLGII